MTTVRTVSAEAPSLVKNFSWTFLGNVIYSACQWGQLVVLAKLGTPSMVGQFSLGLAVTAPVMMFAGLQLRGIQATDAQNQFQFGHYLALRVITTLLALPIIAGVAFLGGHSLETALVVLVMGLAKAIEAGSDVFQGLLQKYERMDRIALSMIVKGVSSLIGLTLVVRVTGSVAWATVSLLACWGLVLLLYDLPNSRRVFAATSHYRAERGGAIASVRPLWQSEVLLKLTWLALPMGLVAMLLSLETNIPRYFLKVYVGEAGLGVFSAMAYVLVGGNAVVSALAQSATPRLAKHFVAKDAAAFQGLVQKLLLVGGAIGVMGVVVASLIGKQLLTLLYTREYAKQANVFLLLMIAAGIGFVSTFLGYSMTAARRLSVQLPLFAVVTAISAATAWWWVPLYGLIGAAWSDVAAATVQLIGSTLIVSRAIAKLRSPAQEVVVIK